MRNLLHSCAKVCAVIELPFGMVNGVDPGIDVLDGSPHASRERGCFWHFLPFAPPFI